MADMFVVGELEWNMHAHLRSVVGYSWKREGTRTSHALPGQDREIGIDQGQGHVIAGDQGQGQETVDHGHEIARGRGQVLGQGNQRGQEDQGQGQALLHTREEAHISLVPVIKEISRGVVRKKTAI